MPTFVVGQQVVAAPNAVTLTEDAIQNPPLKGIVPSLASLGGAPQLPVAHVSLTGGGFSAVVSSPAYVTLFTLPITTKLPASSLWYLLTASWNHSGAFAGSLAANFRFRLNGAILPGGATDNRVRGLIGTVAKTGVVAVTQATNPQTLAVEVTLIGAAANSFNIIPAFGVTLFHADLVIEEQP